MSVGCLRIMLSRLLPCALFVVVSLGAFVSSTRAEEADSTKGRPPFNLQAGRGQDGALRLTWDISEGNYLYRDKIKAVTPTNVDVPISTPPGKIKDDVNFGPVEVYYGTLQATVDGEVLKEADQVRIQFQGCSERGICFPPVTRLVDLATLRVTAEGSAAKPAEPGTDVATWAPSAVERASSILPDMSGFSGLPADWGALIVSFLGFGLLLAFTPCMLPMVPILVGMLSRSHEPLSAIRGFALSATYAVAMAMAYAALGVVAAWSGQNLQIAMQSPYALLFMALIFVALALSSFGLFELRIPVFMPDRAPNAARGSIGSFVGAATLGFTSALIVGPCVTPPLAAALLYVGQTGDVARGAVALFALGLGMGLPLVLVGTFGSGILPRSGAWLLASRQLFGVLFLGVATVLVSRVVPPALSLAIWAALMIGAGVFLGAFDPLRRQAGAVMRLRKAGGILATIYGATLVVGAAAGANDPLRPLVFANGLSVDQRTLPVRTVSSLSALAEAMRDARDQGRTVMIDYSAEWCTACKSFERDVLANPDIRQRLNRVTFIRADVTLTNKDTADLMRRYDVVGPPTLVFVDPSSGEEIKPARSVGETSVVAFGRKIDLAAR